MTVYHVTTTGADLTNNYSQFEPWEYIRTESGHEVWEAETNLHGTEDAAFEQLLNTDSSVMSYITDEVTGMEVLQISAKTPRQFGDNHRNAGFQEGIEIATWKKFGKFYGSVQGIGPDGNAFEGDDVGPFTTRHKTIEAVRDQIAVSNEATE